MELWDLFDENRRPLNRRQSRLAPKVHGEYHLVAVICVVNSKHEILLTLRHPEKEKYPNLWKIPEAVSRQGRRAAQEP